MHNPRIGNLSRRHDGIDEPAVQVALTEHPSWLVEFPGTFVAVKRRVLDPCVRLPGAVWRSHVHGLALVGSDINAVSV